MGFTFPQYDSTCGWTSGSPYTSLVDAIKKRAPLALAMPSALCVPSDPTFSVWMGNSR